MVLGVISVRLESFRDFIDQYGPRICEEGFFLVSDSPPAAGETVTFEVGLADDFRLMQGTGEVAWTVAAGQDPEHPAGAAIRFRDLDESSRRLITRVVHQQRERGGPVFDLGRPPAATGPADEQGEQPFGRLPEAEAGLFDGLQFDLVQQGGFGPPAGAGEQPSVGGDADLEAPPLEPELPGAEAEIELPSGEPEPAVSTAVDRGATAGPSPAAGDAAVPPAMEPAAAEEIPEWMRPIEEPSGPDELLQMPDLAAIGEEGLAVPPLPDRAVVSKSAPAPSLEQKLGPVEEAPVPPAAVPVEPPGPPARPRAEGGRRPSRWRWIAAAVVVVALGAVGVGAYLEGDAVKAWLGLSPAAGGAAPAASAIPAGPAVAPEERAEAGLPTAGPAAPAAEPAAPAAAVFRNVEDVTWQEEAGRTVVIVATDGAVSADRVEILRIEQGDPRVVIKLLGVERPLPQATLPVGTRQVRQIRAGLHAGPGGPELHLVADLTGAEVRPAGVEARGSEIRVSLAGG